MFNSNGTIGKFDEDLFDEHSVRLYRSGDSCILNGGSFSNVLERQLRLNKTYQNIVTKTQLKNRNGDLSGVVISFLSIPTFSHKMGMKSSISITTRDDMSFGSGIKLNILLSWNMKFLKISSTDLVLSKLLVNLESLIEQ